MRAAPAQRFVCDEQLGRLAKWLRLQGYDTVFECPFEDSKLIREAQSEGRVLLTRDRHLGAKTLWEAVVVIRATDYKKQLQELRQTIRLRPARPFSRCLECNVLIQAISKREAEAKVPREVFQTYHRFYICPKCGKIYWRGTHVKNSQKRLQQLMR